MPPISKHAVRFAFWLLVAACSSTTAPGEGSDDSLGPGNHVLTVAVGSVTRTFYVHVPPGPVAARPGILAFHGGGGNARQYQSIAGFDAHADAEGYLVVYPEGSGNGSNSWNAGGCCSTAQLLNSNDVGFGRAIVADLVARGALDPARLYVTGHSNGAMMAHRFTAEASDLVAAAAPYAGSPYFGTTAFAPVRSVPILHIHSVDDPLAIFDGGVSGEGTLKTPVLDQLAYWTTRNGCGAAVVGADSITGPLSGPNAGQSAAWVRWSGCAAGAPVLLRRLTGAGHAWPGMPMSPALVAQLGPGTTLIDIEAEIWGFVSQFRR